MAKEIACCVFYIAHARGPLSCTHTHPTSVAKGRAHAKEDVKGPVFRVDGGHAIKEALQAAATIGRPGQQHLDGRHVGASSVTRLLDLLAELIDVSGLPLRAWAALKKRAETRKHVCSDTALLARCPKPPHNTRGRPQHTQELALSTRRSAH